MVVIVLTGTLPAPRHLRALGEGSMLDLRSPRYILARADAAADRKHQDILARVRASLKARRAAVAAEKISTVKHAIDDIEEENSVGAPSMPDKEKRRRRGEGLDREQGVRQR
jgi:hypothetical protein